MNDWKMNSNLNTNINNFKTIEENLNLNNFNNKIREKGKII